MKSKFGAVLIGISIVIALSSIANLSHDISTLIPVLLFISIPLYLLGHFMRTNLQMLKQHGLRWMSAYVFIVIIIPGLFITMNRYEYLKELTFSNEQFILFDSGGPADLKGIPLLFVMILLILIAFRLFNQDIQRKWILNSMIIGTFIIYGTYEYVMWNDYRGIHEEKGLIIHKWNETEKFIPWHDMKKITIETYIKHATLSNTSDETSIAWKMTFVSQNEETIVYRFNGMNESQIDKGNQVKEIALTKHIPFNVSKMTKKEREWFELELELNDLPVDAFNQFFEIN